MNPTNVLASITEEHLDTGLRGIPVGHCNTSRVAPHEGLFYKGYPIKELSEKEPEEVVYLLLHNQLPSPEELDSFRSELQQLAGLNPKVFDHIKSLPCALHPMKSFMSAINIAGMYHATGDYRRDSLFIIANLPTLTAALIRYHMGWGEVVEKSHETGYIERFVDMLKPPNASRHLTELLKVFEILHLDHGGGNLSTFVGKAIASGHADVYEALVGAMAGLAGPIHGKANQKCFEFLSEMLQAVGDPNDERSINQYLENLWKKGGKIYGFGHAVLRIEDPRATIQYELGERIAPEAPLFLLAKNLRRLATDFLKGQPKISNPYPNVDAVSGSLLHASGITDSSYYTVLFGMSRCVGIAIQILYERTTARGGKGVPLMRPKYLYNGPRG